MNLKITTPWTKLGIKVDLKRFLTRKVLFEKCFPEKSKEIEMTEFIISKLDGCELYLNSDYPDYVFYVKKTNDNQEVLIQKYEKSKTFYIKHSNFWQILENKYRLSYTDVQLFTQIVFEDLLKSHGYKTAVRPALPARWFEDLLKSQGYKTAIRTTVPFFTFEDLLKNQMFFRL